VSVRPCVHVSACPRVNVLTHTNITSLAPGPARRLLDLEKPIRDSIPLIAQRVDPRIIHTRDA